ncbi:hypothetical protein F4X90_21830, partial [Candidatus Poribacteria bacterium]|nr:hypothetical protein [Candidatus Poribacteria bacterium]
MTGLVLSDVRLSGDLGVVPDEYSRLATHGIGYWFYARIPSTLGESGGSIRLQIYRSAVNPYLDSDLDVTIRWNSAGTIEILDTADVVYPELSISLNLDYVAIGDRVIATFRFTEVGTQTIREFTAADVSVTEGITKGTLVEVSNTEYTMEVTAPATGSGQGVISVAENRVYPSNTAASATFTYVDSISVDLSLSAASVEHGGVIAAQFDFDHDVPNFEGSLVAVSNSDATVGNATALDDDNRRWVVPVTAPQSGEGELEISLPEDAIGFSQAAVRAPVQFSDSIPLTIGSFADPLNPYIRDDFQVAIPITGNNVRFVDVTGLLRPFYPDWDPTTGTLYIRGRPTSFYEDLAFKITARDDNTTVEASGTITVIDRMPVIRPPSEIQLAKGHKNSIFIPVDNFPKEGSVKGSWLNLDHQVREDGILIVGDVPADAVFLNANVGTFLVEASNTGGSAPSASVPWKIVSATAPQCKTVKQYQSSGVPHGTHLERYLVFPAGVAINFNLNQFVTGVPVPTLTVDNLGIDGLELSELGYLIGTVTRNVVRDVLFKAENNEGVVYLWIR